MDIEFNVQPTKQESKDEGKDEGEERKRKDMEGAEKTIKRVKKVFFSSSKTFFHPTTSPFCFPLSLVCFFSLCFRSCCECCL